MKIHEKLAECQKVLGPVVARDQEGQVGQRKYKYAGLQGILERVVPVLRDRGLILVETIVNNSLTVSIVDYAPDEPREDLEFIQSVYPLPDTKDAQAFGSAITYGRRYSIVTMMGLVAGDDDDGAAATEAATRPKKPVERTPDQLGAFIDLVGKKLRGDGVDARAASDYAEALIEEWGVLRDLQVRPLDGDTANLAWKDIAAAIEAGKWKDGFAEFVNGRAPF